MSIMSRKMNNADYLLDFTPDDITALAENVDSFVESPSDNDIILPVSSASIFRQSMNQIDQAVYSNDISIPTLSCSSKLVQHEKQLSCIIPEQRSENMLLQDNTVYRSVFSCRATCHQYNSYKMLSLTEYELFDLDKLDIVLNSNSILPIRITCTLNGLDTLKYPLWIGSSLDEVMGYPEFKNIQSSKQDLFQYEIQKAFATTPLSYLLQKHAPHGVLEKLHVHLDWITTDSVMFQSAWNHNLKRELISSYVQDVFIEILIKRTFRFYPLIFSSFYVKVNCIC